MLSRLCLLGFALAVFPAESTLAANGIEGRFKVIEVTSNSLRATLQRTFDGMGLVAQWSSDLVNWRNSGESAGGVRVTISETPSVINGGVETVTFEATRTGSTGGRLFLRVDEEEVAAPPVGFVLVPGGWFQMGSPLGEPTRLVNEAPHFVTLLKPIYMAKTEMIWREWDRVRSWAVDNGYFELSSAGLNGRSGNGGPSGTHPVVNVTWYEVVRWCNARSEQEGKIPVYYSTAGFGSENILRRTTSSTKVYADWSANGYRLPTEAEWEFACRACTQTAFYTGGMTNFESIPVDPNLNLAGWYDGNSGNDTHPVGGKQANAFGLFDMHGNVQEFCWDFYFPTYGGDAIDPKGPDPDSGRTTRITRGGSYGGYAQHCRSAHRDFFAAPVSPSNYIGFRVVLNSSQ